MLERYSSVTFQLFEGLSTDNKSISGKLIDPDTNQQIGHWTFDFALSKTGVAVEKNDCE